LILPNSGESSYKDYKDLKENPLSAKKAHFFNDFLIGFML